MPILRLGQDLLRLTTGSVLSGFCNHLEFILIEDHARLIGSKDPYWHTVFSEQSDDVPDPLNKVACIIFEPRDRIL